MLDPGHWINVEEPRRRVTVLTALVVAMLLFGLLCHPPEALGLADGHTHPGQGGIGHCWTAITSLTAIGFVPLFVALVSFILTLHRRLHSASPFKPPRVFFPTRG